VGEESGKAFYVHFGLAPLFIVGAVDLSYEKLGMTDPFRCEFLPNGSACTMEHKI
jgi:hypothetical protein